MASAFLIRPATPSDAEVIAEFNRRLAWETEHRRLPAARLRRGVEAVLREPARGRYYVATEPGGGAVIGQCSVTYEWSDWRNGDFWWLQSVYVREDWRGRGVFRALFARVRKEARAAAAAGVRLYVEEENRHAQSVYRRHGLEPTRYRIFEREFARKSARA